MSTQTLTLRKCSDGYFRTQWRDENGRAHNRSFGTVRKEAQNRFSNFHAEWRTNRATRNPSEVSLQTLREVYKHFQEHAEAYYRRADGTPTGEAKTLDQAMAPMLALHGDSRLEDLNQASLEAARNQIIRDELSVTTINGYVRKIRHVWKWMANKNYVSPTAWHAMMTVSALKPGRGVSDGGLELKPRVTKPVTAVPEAFALDVCAHLPLTLKTMVMVQTLTGCRSTELCLMRPVDIQTSGAIWHYTPQ